MAGALLGATQTAPPPEPVMDADYIATEADRLAELAAGAGSTGFNYPDLLRWTPPRTQLDAVGSYEGSLAVAGLGRGEPVGDPTPAKGRDQAVWQWLELRFGQHVLVRRRQRPRPLKRELMPGTAPASAPLFDPAPVRPAARPTPTPQRLDLDAATRQAIDSGFDHKLIGRMLIAFADGEGVDFAVGFAAIGAKARVARRGRRADDGSDQRR
jgi:hypothetical protein